MILNQQAPRRPLSIVGLFILAVLASCAGLDSERREARVGEILQRMRTAFGWQAFTRHSPGWIIHGACKEQGLPGTYQRIIDPNGRFVSETHTALPSAHGFDGETLWAVDHTGMPQRPGLGSRDLILGMAWIGNGLWLDPLRPRLRVSVDAAQSTSSQLALDLRSQEGGLHCTVLVSRRSWLAEAYKVHVASGTRTIELGDYERPHGFAIPSSSRLIGVTGEVSTYELESVAPMPSVPGDPFAERVLRPQDTRFLNEYESELEDVRVTASGHILVRPRLNYMDVGWFLLDSGAGMNCITPELADELGLKAFGEISVVGVGGVERSRFRSGGQFELGPMVVKGLPWLEIDLAELQPIFGVQVRGVMGLDVFARSVVEIDRTAERVWVRDPSLFVPPGPASPMVLDMNAPCVECTFSGGHRGWFRLDTGSDDTVTFHGPTVGRLGLTDGRRDLVRVHLAGVGGRLSGLRGPLSWFEICGQRFERPNVTYMNSAPGALNDPNTLGNIGGGLFSGYRLTIDVPHSSIFLTQSSPPPGH